jgi:hypothetical protein
VAERDGELLGVVVSFVREKMWLLASYAVVPEAQGLGLGKAVLAPALDHGRGCLRAMLNASSDPKALRRYHDAGFRLHPQMFLRGTPDRSRIPVVEHVREGRGRQLHRRVVGHRLLEPLRVLVHDHDVHVGHRAQHADVLAPPVAVSDDGNPCLNSLRHRSPRPCDAFPLTDVGAE